MIINIQDNGKKLKETHNVHIADFTVLIGENGTGKTQLLEYLSAPHYVISPSYIDEFGVRRDSSGIISMPDNRILKEDGTALTNTLYFQPGLIFKDEYGGLRNGGQHLMAQILGEWSRYDVAIKSAQFLPAVEGENITEELRKANEAIYYYGRQFCQPTSGFDPSSGHKITVDDFRNISRLAKEAVKDIRDLKFVDFLIFYSIPTDLISPAIDLLFHQHYLKRKYYKERFKDEIHPLEIFNKILQEANFKLLAKYSPSLNEDQPSSVILIDEEGKEIAFSNLSSGETTIMSLIFSLYHSALGGAFPEVILYDEPDAHLHPSLTQTFLNVVEKVVVKENNVKVIMTTHSPSTVAFAPEASIYIMDPVLSRPVKQSRKQAIQILSNGLFQINEEDQKLNISYNINSTELPILFTEGVTDKITLDIAWNKLYPSKQKKFFIQECFSASFLGNLFMQGSLGPEGIFLQYPERIMMALFDFDNAGYGNWNRTKNFPKMIESNPKKCLTRSNGANGYLILLPVPEYEAILPQVMTGPNSTLENDSYLTIELLMFNTPELKRFFDSKPVAGGSIHRFAQSKNKSDFAYALKDIPAQYFGSFIPLFEMIEQITKS